MKNTRTPFSFALSAAAFAVLAVTLALSGCAGPQQSAAAPANPAAGKGLRTALPLKNPSFRADAYGRLTDWITTEHGAGNAYTFVADPVNAHSAPSSARIKRHGMEPYALLEQPVAVDPTWLNRVVRLSGFLKSEGIEGGGGALAIRIDNGNGAILAWNYMADARVKGTQGWRLYSIEIKIPAGATELRIGAMLEDGGTLWADDLRLEMID